MDRLMVVRVSIELQPVECDALRADRDLGQVRTDLSVEAIAVHAEVGRSVAEPKEACRISHEERGSALPGAESMGNSVSLRWYFAPFFGHSKRPPARPA